jgi:hypothetical protein
LTGTHGDHGAAHLRVGGRARQWTTAERDRLQKRHRKHATIAASFRLRLQRDVFPMQK